MRTIWRRIAKGITGSAVCWLGLFVVLMQPGHVVAQPVKRPWTVLIFMNGHNSLSAYGRHNILDMQKVGSHENLQIVVQWAWGQAGNARRLKIEKATDPFYVTSPVLAEMEQVDMGDPETLWNFLEWGMTHFPAQHYMVVLWSHGNGWKATQFSDIAPKISFDTTTRHAISTPALGQIMRRMQARIGHKVDILAADACMMASAEVAAEVADSTQYFMGSQQVIPAYGWPYSRWLEEWYWHPDASAPEIGRMLAEAYTAFYAQEGRHDLTFSVLDLKHMPAYQEAIRHVAQHMIQSPQQNLSLWADTVQRSQYFPFYSYPKKGVAGNPDPELPEFMDWGHFLARLDATPMGMLLQQDHRWQQLKNRAQDLVYWNAVGQSMHHMATGVSVWMPQQADPYYHPMEFRAYQQLVFDKKTHWSQAIAWYLGEHAAQKGIHMGNKKRSFNP